jgi:hypothetical protein
MENSAPQQQKVVRKIRKIKRPKTGFNPSVQQPQAPLKAGAPQAQEKPQSAPKIDFGVPEKQIVRNLPQKGDLKQDKLYTKNSGVENIRFVSEDAPNALQSANIAELLKNKTILLLMGISALFGLFIGASGFSGSESSKHGLDWVVANPDVPAGRSRCGLVDQHQGCVLYIMNPEKRNVTGKDFYSVAAKWTKRERYQIETGNMHYGSKQVKPGYIAQINIPPL